ncbi:cilia- and flagella-associated protein 47 [Suricata suricatta]|uniref:cilia- and flagella-associated protein 47 n=1 Tax=Suricata suricatta TaxID=37032 RepID=UPI001155C928|nr:cilia- and flagella-associated protein 47 [Suricata suricatta]
MENERGSRVPPDGETPKRGSLVPRDGETPKRGSLVPRDGETPKRGSLVPRDGETPKRGSLVPRDGETPKRGSLVPRDGETPKRGSLVPLDGEREVQLRVTPSEVKFLDTLPGRVYRLPVTVHNLGRCNQKIHFQEPLKPQFKLILTNLDKALASGLQMTAMVEYHPDKDEDTSDQLFISIGNKTIEVPLVGLIPACQLEIDSEVDFGTLVANSKVYCKEISIVNHGRAPGTFKTEYQGQLPIVIFPSNGVVEPKSSVIVKVDFCAEQPRIVNEVVQVSLQGCSDMLLSVRAHVVERIIELLNMSGDKLECIHFGSVFFGTSKIEHALLYNNSPEPINWVAIIQDDSVGEELGTNIQQRTDVVLNNLPYLSQIKNIDVTTFISCVPNEGTLLPYQKTVIAFGFSPKLITDGKKNSDPSHRQDYALFLRFESVGSKDGFLSDDNNKTIKGDRFRKVELALTGSGLPVIIRFDPGKLLNFAPCFMGEHSETSCVMQNRSNSLSAMYHFKKTAHFKIDPERGTIDAGHIQNVVCSFVPHQVGVFKVKQLIEIIGSVADENLQSVSLKPFHQVYLYFKSVCKPSTKKVVLKVNPGISPLVSNPMGQFVVRDLAKLEDHVPDAMLQSSMTRFHHHRLSKKSMKDALIAFPNDRAASIRSGDQLKHFRTIFTKIPRYNYVDPEFAYTKSERIIKQEHENYFKRYIKNLRNVRMQKQAERECMDLYNSTDIGLQPASGLKSLSLSEMETEDELSAAQCQIKCNQLLNTRDIASKETQALKRKVLKGLKSDPSTPHEKHDCSLILTPKQIHQVIVGPSVLNFGDICVNSTNTRLLHVVNMLPMHILIQLDINLKELRKTNQFSYVIPPTASTYISMVFESPTIGKFWKSFTFTVNNIPGGHILVMADVMPVELELSSKELVLRPQGFSVKTCFMRTVGLYNRQNYFVKFEWEPVNTEGGMAFSIRPAKGTVDPYSSLECEVTWQPGFSSPENGEFVLHVNEGKTVTLKCVAQIGHTKVVYLEPRIHFSNSPQGLTTWRKAILHNVGQNHAYFKVCDQRLLPTIKIVPSQGIIPFGGLTVLNISCTPTVAEKFDTRAKVAIRHADVIDLRIGGSVEVADVEINPDVFKFSATYVGATQTIPFIIKNKGITRARVQFNLQNFEYFSMDFKQKLGQLTDPASPNIYSSELEEGTSVECGIVFSPKEVTTFDFCIQVQINSFEASELYTEACLSESAMTPKTAPLIRPCYVHATVLQAPLRLSSTEFIFAIPLHTLNPNDKVTETQDLVLHNISKQDVKWTLDISNTGKLFKDGTFRISVLSGVLQSHAEFNVSISFCPNHPGKYTADIPIRVDENPVCYRMLCLVGEVKSPTLSFDPPFIFFTPVPLDVATKVDVNILPQNYFRDSTLNVQIPTVSFLDGDEAHPLSVTFPKGRVITGSSSGVNAPLTCSVSFKSSKPVSFFIDIIFCDNSNNWFLLPVTATAENCLLTIYSYMATHLDTRTIILTEDKSDISVKSGGNVLLPYQEAGLLSSASNKCDDVEPAKKKLFVGIKTPESLDSSKSKMSDKERSIKKEEKNEQFFTPEEGTKAYDFFEKVVHAAQTWFSLFGWPRGPHSFSIPETIRREVFKMQSYSTTSPFQQFSRRNDFSKYNKTIYDVILHLSGKLPPGIHSSLSSPADYTERVIQLHFQHSSLLNFLNDQGACISHILPEFLLEPEDYKKWLEIYSSTNTLPVCSCASKEKPSIVIDMTQFEAWSKWAWTDVFLQIYKVLVLSRVVPHCSNSLPPIHVQNSPKINPCFISSNIYSKSERILLNWMNTNYENARHIIWKNCQKGVIPSERWIVNFDKDLLDGLVFATQLGVYCPFLIESHFVNMYTQPKSSEQYLHNCLIIVNVLREIDIDMDIQATDICDPNPILMLMLCVYMYERLPTYLPRKVVPFHCTLHDTVLRQILLKNSSLENLVYNATIVGKDAADFSLSQTGNTVTISSKNEISITVKFTSRFLHPAEASLLLISKPKHRVRGTTITFALKGEVLNFKAIEIINCTSPCYTWKEITIKVKNPFNTAGDFSVTLVESSTFISLPSQLTESGQLINPMNNGDAGSRRESDSVENCWHFSNALKTSIKSTFIREFFCSTHTLHLEVKGTSNLELLFLPFDMHTRYCVIIFSNKAIGEFIYIVEGKGTIPLPSSFHPTDFSTPPDYRSSPEEVLSKDNPVLYLKCELGGVLDVNLKLPLTNEAKERALAFAAQQQMSDVEYERRLITGTLESSSVRVAVALLGLTKIETCMLFTTSKLRKPKFILYTAELSLPEYFDIPKKIYIPQVPETQAKLTQPQGMKSANKTVSDGSVLFPLQFVPLSAGRYPCKILLTSRYDVRLYCIEGIVNEEGPEARFEFETPAFEALTQNIPIKNKTKHEWKYQVTIQGEWFYGPSVLYVGPGETVQYPLTFRPILECEIMGKLTLQNEADGMEHVFDIKGIGKRPVALEHIIIDCQVGEVTNKHLIVPNYTNTIQTFKVFSDLPMVWGDADITVDPDNIIPYILHISPWKRGIFKGTVTFSVERKLEGTSPSEEDLHQYCDQVPSFQKSLLQLSPCVNKEDSGAVSFSVKRTQEDSSQEDSDPYYEQVPLFQKSSQLSLHVDEEDSGAVSYSVKRRQTSESRKDSDPYYNHVPTFQKSLTEVSPHVDKEDSDDGASNFHVWYNLEIHSSPGPPVDIIEIKCPALESVYINIPLSNPKKRSIYLDVQLSNDAFNGLKKLKLHPLESTSYMVRYSPVTTGYRDESIVFQPNVDLEFWYLLKLTTELPRPTTMPDVQCDLGTYETQTIYLVNPTHETLELQATNSNPENFVLGVHKSVLTVPPHSFKEVAVHFRPSALGRTGHQASISFYCAQFAEWRFSLSGVGLFPQPIAIKTMTSYVRLQSSVVINFQNPTKEDVLIDIILTSQEKPKHLTLDPSWCKFFKQTSAFKFSGLSHTQGILLPPKGNIDLPVLFMPNIMKLHRTMVIVQMMRANRQRWPIDNFDELDAEMKRTMGTESGEIAAIHWIYPILGLPQALLSKGPPIVITCQSRKRVEEEVEVTLTGAFFGENSIPDPTDFTVIPKRRPSTFDKDVPDMLQTREFEYEIQFESDVVESSLESCIALYLIKKSFNIKAEMITLVFNFIFTPKKPLRTQITLKIECITDGIWKFPIVLDATEPDVDDVIDIEGVGLFKESFVNFRLTSQTRIPEPFTAHFLPGSDPEFFVKPKVGTLLPFHTKGTLIAVGFKPQMYSRKYKATLVIQTPDMYWLYNINGLPPVTMPPMNVKAKTDSTNEMFAKKPVRRHNFIRENAKLIRTGVSSTIKGAPLMLKNK